MTKRMPYPWSGRSPWSAVAPGCRWVIPKAKHVFRKLHRDGLNVVEFLPLSPIGPNIRRMPRSGGGCFFEVGLVEASSNRVFRMLVTCKRKQAVCKAASVANVYPS